jgi:hypothetical protein
VKTVIRPLYNGRITHDLLFANAWYKEYRIKPVPLPGILAIEQPQPFVCRFAKRGKNIPGLRTGRQEKDGNNQYVFY